MTSLGDVEIPQVDGTQYEHLAAVSVRRPEVFAAVDKVLIGSPVQVLNKAREGREV